MILAVPSRHYQSESCAFPSILLTGVCNNGRKTLCFPLLARPLPRRLVYLPDGRAGNGLLLAPGSPKIEPGPALSRLHPQFFYDFQNPKAEPKAKPGELARGKQIRAILRKASIAFSLDLSREKGRDHRHAHFHEGDPRVRPPCAFGSATCSVPELREFHALQAAHWFWDPLLVLPDVTLGIRKAARFQACMCSQEEKQLGNQQTQAREAG